MKRKISTNSFQLMVRSYAAVVLINTVVIVSTLLTKKVDLRLSKSTHGIERRRLMAKKDRCNDCGGPLTPKPDHYPWCGARRKAKKK